MVLIKDSGTNQKDEFNWFDELVVEINLIKDALDAVLTKLDADAGITDTDYQSKHGKGGSDSAAMSTTVTSLDR